MAGEGGQMSTGAGGTPASQQQPSTLLSSPAGSAGLPGLMSSSGASGVSQTALTASQLQQQKNQQAQRASLYTQGAPIQAVQQQQHLPGMASTPPGGTQLSRSLSGQRLTHLQQPGMTMVQRPTAAGGVGTTHYNQQYLSTSVAATSPGATTPSMMLAQQRAAQGQQQRPNTVAQGSQTRPGSYMPQTQQQYTSGQYVHHMGSIPMNAVRPGVQGTLLSGAGAQQYTNQQYLAQQTLQARQKQNQGQAPATHFQGTAAPGQQQMTMARQGGALPSQPQQQQQQQQQQQTLQQQQQQRLAQPQQQALARQPQTQQGLPSPGNNMLSRAPSTGAQMQGLAAGSQQQQLWQGKPSQLQQQQQQQQGIQQTQRPQTAANTLAIDRARPGTPGASQPNAAPSSAGGANADPGDASSHILGKRSIQDLLAQVDSRERLDPDVEDVLLEIADDFIESVTSFACKLAKHRKSNVLEAKDVLLHLDKQWNITVPGFGGEEYRSYKRPAVAEVHRQRLAVVRKSLAAAQPAAGAAPAPATNVSTPVRGGLSSMAPGTLASPTASPGLPRIPRV